MNRKPQLKGPLSLCLALTFSQEILSQIYCIVALWFPIPTFYDWRATDVSPVVKRDKKFKGFITSIPWGHNLGVKSQKLMYFFKNLRQMLFLARIDKLHEYIK